MTSAVFDWPMTGVHCNKSVLEELIGARLQAVWATIPLEPLPTTLWTAIALHGGCSGDALEPKMPRLQDQSEDLLRCFGLGNVADWLDRRRQLSQQKMYMKATRKQGNAWLVVNDPDYFS